MAEILRVENLTKHFVKKSWLGREAAVVRAVDGVSFAVEAGQIFVLAGESGSGKSTVAKAILGAVRPDSGRVFFDGRDIATKEDLKHVRAQCQMVYQDPYDSINPQMKIKDIIAEPAEIHGVGDPKQRRQMVLDALREVRLEPADQIMEKYPHTLSGGQRQRVVLARALILRPKMIIADEPVSMLDVSVRAEILELMEELNKKHGISFVYITHDLATARYFGHKIAIMYRGRIVEMGQINDVLLHPYHPYTQALIDAVLEPDPKNLHAEKTIRIKEAGSEPQSGCRFSARCPYAFEKCSGEPELEERDGRKVACFADIERLAGN